MIRKTLAWIAGAVAAMLVGVPGVARATTVWTPASCAVGSFDPVTVDPQGHYLLPAHMSLCGPYQPGFTYEIVAFRPGGYIPMATGNNLQSYYRSDVTADVYPRVPTPLFGLCLMRAVDARTACVRVETAADGTATSTPIPIDDPLVAEQVLFFQNPPVINPTYCATCVSVNF